MAMPDGLALSADERTLYVIDDGKSHVDGPAHVRPFRIDDGAEVNDGEVVADFPVGIFDGLRLDRNDNLWISMGEDVYC